MILRVTVSKALLVSMRMRDVDFVIFDGVSFVDKEFQGQHMFCRVASSNRRLEDLICKRSPARFYSVNEVLCSNSQIKIIP